MARRIANHELLLSQGAHGNAFLQADYSECGPRGFEYEALERGVEWPDLLHRERVWIYERRPIYNCFPWGLEGKLVPAVRAKKERRAALLASSLQTIDDEIDTFVASGLYATADQDDR
jgi:hypothetical protein